MTKLPSEPRNALENELNFAPGTSGAACPLKTSVVNGATACAEAQATAHVPKAIILFMFMRKTPLLRRFGQ
jgi:hypothetical protein